MIEIKSISKTYNSKKVTTHALKNISFKVFEGEISGKRLE